MKRSILLHSYNVMWACAVEQSQSLVAFVKRDIFGFRQASQSVDRQINLFNFSRVFFYCDFVCITVHSNYYDAREKSYEYLWTVEISSTTRRVSGFRFLHKISRFFFFFFLDNVRAGYLVYFDSCLPTNSFNEQKANIWHQRRDVRFKNRVEN